MASNVGMEDIDNSMTQDPSNSEDFGTMGEIITRTVVLKCVNKHRPFFRQDFYEHLGDLLQDEDVVAFGSVGRNDLWHLVVESKEAKTRVMAAGDFYVDRTLVKVSALGKEEFLARIHWAPLHIPMDCITFGLARTCEVISSKFERSPKSVWSHAPTLVRTVLLRGDMENVPHLMDVGCGKYKCTVLVTITGRKPVCLRCKGIGHMRNDCVTPYCRLCKEYGHMPEDCKRPKSVPSYSRTVQGKPTDLSQHEDSQSILSQHPPSLSAEKQVSSVQQPGDQLAKSKPIQPTADTQTDTDDTKVIHTTQESVVIPCAQPPKIQEVSSESEMIPDTQPEEFKVVPGKRKVPTNSPNRSTKKVPKVGDPSTVPNSPSFGTPSSFSVLEGVNEMGEFSDTGSDITTSQEGRSWGNDDSWS